MRRFYADVSVDQVGDGGWRVLLDGKPVRTAGGNPQVAPARALARTLADEWAAQGPTIDPATLPARHLADTAIDVVAGRPEETVRALLAYAGTDTLLYRADPDEPLHARQRELWEPIVTAAERGHDVRFARISGIIARPQPAATIARLETELRRADAFTLASLNVLASLSASLIVALAAAMPDADVTMLWTAAELEEDWQAGLWGRDPEAEHRRTRRAAAFAHAARFASLAGERAAAD